MSGVSFNLFSIINVNNISCLLFISESAIPPSKVTPKLITLLLIEVKIPLKDESIGLVNDKSGSVVSDIINPPVLSNDRIFDCTETLMLSV